jgi:hypothetical protein
VANLPLAAPSAPSGSSASSAPVADAALAAGKKGARRDKLTVDLFGDSTGEDRP